MNEVLIEVKNLKKYFPLKRSISEFLTGKEQKFVKAVDDISFIIKKGETLGLVGESGSGKTTTGRMVLRLLEPTSGTIKIDDIDITSLTNEELRKFRRKIQIIFQDPMAALNPYMKIGEAIRHALQIHKVGKNYSEQKKIVYEIMERVNLKPAEEYYNRYPRDLSGGQRQRVVIARALVLKPEFVVADEAIAMLDVSVRSQLLKLMIDLKEEFNLTYLFITHDLATTKYICDRIAVMYLGKIVEIGTFEDIYRNPAHPYTKALISAVPEPDPKLKKKKIIPKGEVPNAVNPPKGCRFHPRCPYAMDICKVEEPKTIKLDNQHEVNCHLFNK
ncbi:peptide ABC transporter ATPase [Marinitoga sp. 1197]|uniref:ABC transporter ATP-binding protein n=1 Tax=unclassified Marinitoga TaxID=2640159 RepID=UPI0006417F08|nr:MULTISPECIES: ABC transporter ATP-binding protein [unclassified Marinitoga]KLO22209.1 peptide ABC transporter ATPase [Marinitoga sp. 1155]KLO23770.1 peptide ABC transporter ATPase [Marinitoga sp. 1197]NUU99896.1 peptide ABC transporter ATPase [Marinitoga sp. 1154]